MSNTIKLKNYLNVFEEYDAHEAITPGMLIMVNSDDEVAVHDTADGNVLPMFAIEDELQGNGIDDAYAAGDKVQVWIPTRGDQVNALLLDEETVVIGDFLTSGGSGYLKKLDVAASAAVIEAPMIIVAQALEALDLSSSSAATTAAMRIKVRIV